MARSTPLLQCPHLEGMLKAESSGDQRVRNLLFGQNVWVPAYCVLDEGVLTCYKDRAHAHCVEAFDMAETRVVASPDRSRPILAFTCETDHGPVVVDMLAKDADEAASWVRACLLARKWAERNKRTRLGLAPLNPAAMKLVGARKLAKKHELGLKASCLFAWIDAACATVTAPHLPAIPGGSPPLHPSEPPSAPPPPERRSEAAVRERVQEAFIPGQQRRVRNVNGRVTAFRPRPPNEIERERRAEAEARSRRSVEEGRALQEGRRHATAQEALRRRASDGHTRTYADLQADLVDMVPPGPSSPTPSLHCQTDFSTDPSHSDS